jgi:site-specific DNA-methyltransferase (adenine-specific)
MNEVLFSSNKEDWETPIDFFNILDEEFHFSLDPCADHNNHKCDKYYTKEQDGLSQDWGGELRFLQSALRERIYGTLDKEMFRRSTQAKYNSSYAYTFTDGYKSFS